MTKQRREEDLLLQKVVAEETKKFLDENRAEVLRRVAKRLKGDK